MEAEKIYCTDGGDKALAYAAMANANRQDPMAMAAMMGNGMGGQWNNPFIYLVWMMFAQRMWGDGYGNGSKLQDAEIQINPCKRTEMIIIVPQRSETAKGGALQQYIEKHGRHFTAALADYVCGMMANADGTTHMWNTAEVAEAYRQTGHTDKGTLSDGDICYLANMAYADFYPSPLTSTSACIDYAYRIATDPDGYNGLPFTRWLADMNAKGECLDFARFLE